MKDFDEVYAAFSRLYADGKPGRPADHLHAAMKAAELEPAQITETWLLSLDSAWVYGESDRPFPDSREFNRLYGKLIATK